MQPLQIGIVGFGKIAREQHLPAIARTEGVELCAVASLAGCADGVPTYRSLCEMLAKHKHINAIAMCQPPAARFEAAREALEAGCHVLLEKPPGASVTEVRLLEQLAAARGLTMFTAWHSRFAAGVAELREWCRDRTVSRVEVEWREDVRRWHPGQDWIWQAGGFGVFDPGINALSILTHVLGDDLQLRESTLTIPANCETPIADSMTMESASGVPIAAEFDWRQSGPQIWRISCQSGSEVRVFDAGGGACEPIAEAMSPVLSPVLSAEYLAIYRHFVELVAAGRSDVDCTPLQVATDALRRGRVVAAETWDRQA